MKRCVENLILTCFAVFFIGGFLLVCIQTIGLIVGQAELVIHAKRMFAWIYPLAALAGFMCYVYSYMKK